MQEPFATCVNARSVTKARPQGDVIWTSMATIHYSIHEHNLKVIVIYTDNTLKYQYYLLIKRYRNYTI